MPTSNYADAQCIGCGGKRHALRRCLRCYDELMSTMRMDAARKLLTKPGPNRSERPERITRVLDAVRESDGLTVIQVADVVDLARSKAQAALRALLSIGEIYRERVDGSRSFTYFIAGAS